MPVKIPSLLIATLLIPLLWACDSEQKFTIEGEVKGAGARTLTLTYLADGGLKRISVPAVDGVFAISAASTVPSLATLAMSDGTPIGTLVVENGMEITLTADISDPTKIEIEGSDPSKKIAEWIADNAEAIKKSDSETINRSIARFIADNTSDIASTALLVSQFHTEGYEPLADSLFTIIDTSARPTAMVQNFNAVLASQMSTSAFADISAMTLYEYRDSLINYNPRSYTASMLCFLPENKTARDTIIPTLRQITDRLTDRPFTVIEISTAADSAGWKSSVAGDSSVNWFRTWAPGTVASPIIRRLAIPRSPYFIVADGQGTQIYRGSSVKAAERNLLSKFD